MTQHSERRVSTTWGHGFSALVACAISMAGCAGAVESSKREDKARREVPVPICLKSMERHGSEGVVSALKPEDYWALVLPSYDPAAGTVDLSAADCAGRPVLASSALMGAEGARSGIVPVKPQDASITPGPDKFKIVWLRTHRFADGGAGGPIALVRPREGHAEVYAVGVYRGHAEKSRFAIERMGPRILITASDDGCTKVKPGDSCETSLSVYLMRAGELMPAAHIPLDRIAYGTAPGDGSSVQYRLTATPVFEDKRIRVVEQVVVSDSTQTALRKSNLERVFKLQPRGQLSANRESLWSQVTGEKRAPAAPEQN